MSDVKKCLFREMDTDQFVEINPLHVRLLRQLPDCTEIVFSETHSVRVKRSRVAVSKAFEGRNAWDADFAPHFETVSSA